MTNDAKEQEIEELASHIRAFNKCNFTPIQYAEHLLELGYRPPSHEVKIAWPERCIETGCDNPRESGWEEGHNACHEKFMKVIKAAAQDHLTAQVHKGAVSVDESSKRKIGVTVNIDEHKISLMINDAIKRVQARLNAQACQHNWSKPTTGIGHQFCMNPGCEEEQIINLPIEPSPVDAAGKGLWDLLSERNFDSAEIRLIQQCVDIAGYKLGDAAGKLVALDGAIFPLSAIQRICGVGIAKAMQVRDVICERYGTSGKPLDEDKLDQIIKNVFATTEVWTGADIDLCKLRVALVTAICSTFTAPSRIEFKKIPGDKDEVHD